MRSASHNIARFFEIGGKETVELRLEQVGPAVLFHLRVETKIGKGKTFIEISDFRTGRGEARFTRN